ncbi:MAG: hypothetical protein B6D57_04885 [Candidatus Coatesbacteria bacterium 4484_99]|uniref:peptidylprolyl isomerase n=1 Tax=Candidatus Coatesbacteria bacterium 4484_99 TaxID=1970774 RepID=A0A1W9RZT0_9BACT|nr:MAG: hypothetical protein B6D57_04885 [Candidatus Coatesbacteria bacterium 4484_99]RLC45045.1 MAG: hypothetical protein DRH44_00020 [Candidatus Coatesbacteria bacterium]
MFIRHKYLIFILVVLATINCTKKSTDDIAIVGNISITRDDIKARIAEYSLEEAQLTSEAIDAILNELIERALILNRSIELGIDITDEETRSFQEKISRIGGSIDSDSARRELLIQKTIDLEVGQQIKVTKSEEKEENPSESKMVIFSEITTQSEEEIKRISALLSEGKDFRSVIDESPDTDTLLSTSSTGPVDIASLPLSFQEVLKNIPEGGISSPFKSPYGYHIIRLDGWVEGGEIGESVELKIRNNYLEAYKKWIDNMKKEIYIDINRNNLKAFKEEILK